MKTLNEQVQKLEKILKERGVSVKSITTENGYIKLTHKNEKMRYYVPSLEYYTSWGKQINFKSGLIKLTHKDGDVRYYTRDLKYFTPWTKSITNENGFIKLTNQDGEIRYYTPDLKHSTPWGMHDSIVIKNGVVEVSNKIKYSRALEKIN